MSQQAQKFTINSQVTVDAVFRDLDGNLQSPTVVTCLVMSPSGVRVLPTAEEDSEGIWFAAFVITESGRWKYAFEGTGALIAASPTGYFDVDESPFHDP